MKPLSGCSFDRHTRTDIKDTVFQGTPLGWAQHAGRTDLEKYLH
jgi:hypothetical protein